MPTSDVGAFSTTVTNDMKSSATVTLTSKWNVLDTQKQSQSATIAITGPSCSANYTGLTNMQVWKDNAYGTFMFWPR